MSQLSFHLHPNMELHMPVWQCKGRFLWFQIAHAIYKDSSPTNIKIYQSQWYRPGGGGGVLPIWWVIHMCRGFDPLFWPSGYQTLSFWGVFFSSTNTKTIFWVQILTKFDLFGPKIPFSPRSFWVQFSVAHGTPPAIFGPSTPPGVQVSMYDILVSWILCRMHLYAHKSQLNVRDK